MKLHHILLLLVFIFNFGFFEVLIAQEKTPHNLMVVDCKTCHSCEVPTVDDPCLNPCIRFSLIVESPPASQGPDIIVIEELADRYDPVVFSHNAHALMSEMSGGCSSCHHFNTTGPILKCNNCHSTERQRENINRPDLKGAYHQQCMNCHRQWSRQTECLSCHPETDQKLTSDELIKRAELLSPRHPEVKAPGKVVYKTETKEGNKVTFYHNEHTDIFGVDCVSCHKDENCIRCHDVNNANKDISFYDSPVALRTTEAERHSKCFSCHENDKCSACHSNDELKPFNHKQSTGWALNKHHIYLSCQKCHKQQGLFKKMDSGCTSCHSDFTAEKFDHSVTGLKLDEVHLSFDCGDCHEDSDFSKPSACTSCHEDFSYPKNKPGKLISN